MVFHYNIEGKNTEQTDVYHYIFGLNSRVVREQLEHVLSKSGSRDFGGSQATQGLQLQEQYCS